MTHRLRRNDIVRQKKDGWFYGRVWKRVDDDHVVVICCGKHITTYRDDELEVHNDYKGKWSQSFDGQVRDRYPVFYRMPTLRELKQYAACYHPEVWSKPKPRLSKSYMKIREKEKIYAPWTDRQMELIADFQRDGQWAPETCSNHYQEDQKEAHEAYEEAHGLKSRGAMIVTRDGLVCPVCKETKNFAEKYMLLGDFRKDR